MVTLKPTIAKDKKKCAIIYVILFHQFFFFFFFFFFSRELDLEFARFDFQDFHKEHEDGLIAAFPVFFTVGKFHCSPRALA